MSATSENIQEQRDELHARCRDLENENQQLREQSALVIRQRDEEALRHDALRTELRELHPEVGIDPQYARHRRFVPGQVDDSGA